MSMHTMERSKLQALAGELAKGLSTREIVAAFNEMYDADVSATRIPNELTQNFLQGPPD